MSTLQQKVDDFLAQRNIAVVGVSRSEKSEGVANVIYRKLRDGGYQVFAINPNAETVEGDPCYPNLAATPQPIDGVVIGTRPETANQIVRECVNLGISRVWMHRSFGQGSVSTEATEFCEANNITVIPGGCPMMFCDPVDFGHKCIRWWLGLTGGLPK
jgi:predicted CoA-binding protein